MTKSKRERERREQLTARIVRLGLSEQIPALRFAGPLSVPLPYTPPLISYYSGFRKLWL